mmetsp:Transcript_14521/g.38606  ORF Transcript_14521/g.38606 Transcript_14521/m.38606 type:complete len:230 (-) Transcript_14521:1618-2307(-)
MAASPSVWARLPAREACRGSRADRTLPPVLLDRRRCKMPRRRSLRSAAMPAEPGLPCGSWRRSRSRGQCGERKPAATGSAAPEAPAPRPRCGRVGGLRARAMVPGTPRARVGSDDTPSSARPGPPLWGADSAAGRRPAPRRHGRAARPWVRRRGGPPAARRPASAGPARGPAAGARGRASSSCSSAGCRRAPTAPPPAWASTCSGARPPRGPGRQGCPSPGPRPSRASW